jgi:hypothetical protein
VTRVIGRRWLAVLLVAVVSVLGPVGAAYGQTPAGSQYSGNLGVSASGGGGSALPFTGLDLGGIAGAGAVMIGAGVLLRRRAHTARS